MNNIKIGVKLIGGFLIVALVALFIGVFGISQMKTIADADTQLYEKVVEPLGQIGIAQASFHQVRVNLRDMIRANDPEVIRQKGLRVDELSGIISSNIDLYEKTLHTDAGKKTFADFQDARNLFRNHLTAIKELASANKDVEAFALVDGDAAVSAKAEQATIEKMVEQKIQLGNAEADENTKIYMQARTLMVSILIVGIVIALLLGIFLSLSITGPLQKGVAMMLEMAKGHLGTRLHMTRKDEIGILATTMDEFSEDLQKNLVATVVKIGEGDLSTDMRPKDGKDEITPAIINTTVAIRNLITEAGTLSKAAVEGRLATRGDVSRYKGGYREIVEGVNMTLDAVIGPINEAQAVMEKVAARDMTARVKGDYKGDLGKIKDAINMAVDNLDQALTQVAEATEQVSSGSQQISAGSQSLAQGANEQASSLEEVSSSLEEMSSMTKQNAENANQANNLAAEANTNAAQGGEAMRRMSTSINKIKDSSDQTAKIVKTIDEIAMQTNLLALNAAVEAARAGEAGRGFAVVAEEVRNLAQRSAEAAKNTANMIEESVKNAEEGVTISIEVSKSFESISGSVKKVNDLIAEIAAASQEQSQGIDQVNTAVAQMDKVTQQNAANSEESASAAEEMSSQAEELQSMIAQFALSQSIQSKNMTSSAHHVKKPAPEVKLAASSAQKNGNGKKHLKGSEYAMTHRGHAEQMIPLDDEVLKSF